VKLEGIEKNRPELTDADRNIASLKLLIADLSTQLEALTSKINDLDVKTRVAVSRKNRVAALASLRSKKLHETIYTRRAETFAQLEATYTKIEEAADQVEVVKVMQASAKILKGLNDQVGSIETVEEVLDRLRTEMTQVEDVGAAIAEAGQESSMIDEGAIDEELEALEKENQAEIEEKAAKETRERLERLESVASLEIQGPVSTTSGTSDATALTDLSAEHVDPENKKPLDEKESDQPPEEAQPEPPKQSEVLAV
jgi:charged multivesicular body protein 7